MRAVLRCVEFIQLYLPKNPADILSCAFMIIVINVTALYELIIVIPYIEQNHNGHYWLHVMFGALLYQNVVISLYKAMTVDATSGHLVLPSVLKPGWRFCSACESNAPPRSHHCHVCNRCVLKRDHHCMFTGNCVGHANHRYFILLMTYICVGALYCNYLNMDYTLEVLGGLNWVSALTMFVPMVTWVFGLTPAFTLMVAFVSSLCLVGNILVGVFLFYHVRNALSGQTTHERSHGTREHDMGWRQNVAVVMGRRWQLGWLHPLVSSPLPGDGLEFSKRNKWVYEDVKDI